jgi:hypothetical protein
MSFHQFIPINYVTQVEIRITTLEDKMYTSAKTLQNLFDKVNAVNAIQAKVDNIP